MRAASQAKRDSPHARLLVVRPNRQIQHWQRSALPELLVRGDLLVANDAATLPASLPGVHLPTGRTIEVRLAGRHCLDHERVNEFAAVVFGSGDFRVRTEDRPHPPKLNCGDRLALGPLSASVERVLRHPRLIWLRLYGSPGQIWEGLARHGRPIQYAHVPQPLSLWDVWTALAGAPVAFEAPSAGFALNWKVLAALADRGVRVATLTHAAGISSTGDASLDARLPLAEAYSIPATTAQAIRDARMRGSRVIAVGTTVVRALEHAASLAREVLPGEGLATQVLGAGSRLRVVDMLLSGTHQKGSSHHELLRAFVDDYTLESMDRELERHRYLTHEFGDSILVTRRLSRKIAQPVRVLPDARQRRLGGNPADRLCRSKHPGARKAGLPAGKPQMMECIRGHDERLKSVSD
jgi:S-adenosylmethionine:tRNA ribosyltransferase-isomerase